jgi:hypothetical protein
MEELMPKPKNVMEIFEHLEKSNCRECGEKTCLAFAGAVYQARKKISLCPRLDLEIIEKYSISKTQGLEMKQEMGELFVKELLVSLDFQEAAERSGGNYNGTVLSVKVLGKNFGVKSDGTFTTDIHINTWITGPFLDYMIHGIGMNPTGEWISFRELKGSDDLIYSFFRRRCESALLRIADTYTDLFDDLVYIFGGKKVEKQFEADISVVLYPFPKTPFMICYMMPEDSLPSTLNLFFDRSVDANLSVGAVMTLCSGFAIMTEKITEKHGVNAV